MFHELRLVRPVTAVLASGCKSQVLGHRSWSDHQDMKNGMIISVRRSLGLGDKFFYNNGQECANFKYKSKINESKTQITIGYRPNTKCTWVEAISMYKNLVEETNRDEQLAVLQKGPFQLSPRYNHLRDPSLRWSKMTTTQRQRHLAKLNISQKNGRELVVDPDCQGEGSAKGTDNDCNVIGNFDEFNLPEFLKGTWKNASRIVALEGIARALSKWCRQENCHISVISNSTHCRDQIEGEGICIPWTRKRKWAGNPPRDFSQYGERVEACQVSGDVSSPYELVFVKDTSATTCYGCKGRIREKPSAPSPSSPYDLFIRHSEIRVYNRPGDTKLWLSSKPEMFFFIHL